MTEDIVRPRPILKPNAFVCAVFRELLNCLTSALLRCFRLRFAADAWRNRIAVGTGFRMSEERTDALVEFGRDDVLEAARLHVGFGVFDRKSIGEEPFGQAMTAHYITRAA